MHRAVNQGLSKSWMTNFFLELVVLLPLVYSTAVTPWPCVEPVTLRSVRWLSFLTPTESTCSRESSLTYSRAIYSILLSTLMRWNLILNSFVAINIVIHVHVHVHVYTIWVGFLQGSDWCSIEVEWISQTGTDSPCRHHRRRGGEWTL